MSLADQRRWIMRRRRTCKPRRRLDVIRREGLVLTYRCRDCGATSTTTCANEFEARFYARYHAEAQGGTGGECKACTKRVRDELYPLPKKEK